LKEAIRLSLPTAFGTISSPYTFEKFAQAVASEHNIYVNHAKK